MVTQGTYSLDIVLVYHDGSNQTLHPQQHISEGCQISYLQIVQISLTKTRQYEGSWGWGDSKRSFSVGYFQD